MDPKLCPSCSAVNFIWIYVTEVVRDLYDGKYTIGNYVCPACLEEFEHSKIMASQTWIPPKKGHLQ
jgi:hypothetical protein